MRSLILYPLALVLAACTVPKILGDDPTDAAGSEDGSGTLGISSAPESSTDAPGTAPLPGTSTGEAESSVGFTTGVDPDSDSGGFTTDVGPETTTLGPGTTSATDTDGPAMVCPTREGFECTFPTDCDLVLCGHLGSAFAADGCPRLPCVSTADCAEGEVCYVPDEWGFEGCSPTLIGSENGDGACEYILDGECGGRYCVADGPPADCPALTDAASCLAAGCSNFAAAPTLTFDGACQCGEPLDLCLWHPGGDVGGDDVQTAYYNLGTQEVVVLGADYQTPPHGWAKCLGDPAEPPACQQCREFAASCG